MDDEISGIPMTRERMTGRNETRSKWEIDFQSWSRSNEFHQVEVYAEKGRFQVQFLANDNSPNCNNFQGEHSDLKLCLVDLRDVERGEYRKE